MSAKRMLVCILTIVAVLMCGGVYNSIGLQLVSNASVEEASIITNEKMEIRHISTDNLKERAEAVKVEADTAIRLHQEKEQKKQEHRDAMVSRGSYSGGFSTFDVRTPSGLTAKQLDKCLEGTGLAGLGEDFVKAEEKTGVNALCLASIAAHESAWGRSDFAKQRNNLFGYKAYDHDVNKAMWFKTKGEAIMVVAQALKDEYLTEGGPHFNGYTLADINKKYASDKKWHSNIAEIMSKLAKKIEK